MRWLAGFAKTAQRTDQFRGRVDHTELLAAGLMGEAGSVVTELKKKQREKKAYPAHRQKLYEEIGDFLWYFIRLISVVDPALLGKLHVSASEERRRGNSRSISRYIEFGAAVGDVLPRIRGARTSRGSADLRGTLLRVWNTLVVVASRAHVNLMSAAEGNVRKIESRWPTKRVYTPLFDEGFAEEEQIPRRLAVEFRERNRGRQKVVTLHCNRLNFGDRLTDNIRDPDGYRFHDVFHFAYAAHLGWSPVVRALLRCKRKSSPTLDEAEDGARAGILEEAVAAVVFSRAKHLNYFDGIDHLDYDILKTVKEFVQGYEVESAPLWQWEAAILNGYSVFRQLRSNGGGRAVLDLKRRRLTYLAPSRIRRG